MPIPTKPLNQFKKKKKIVCVCARTHFQKASYSISGCTSTTSALIAGSLISSLGVSLAAGFPR